MDLDVMLFNALNQAGGGPGLDLLMVCLSFLGLTYVIVLVGPILWHWKRREMAVDVVVLVIVTMFLTEGLKLLLMRERPFEVLASARTLDWGWLSLATGPAMPSGHAARAFAVAALLASAVRPRWGALALGLAAMVGVSRIYLGLHWPSDVLVGALLGIVLAAGMHWIGKGDNAYTRIRGRSIAWLDAKLSFADGR